MTGPVSKAPWILARSAQGVIALAAVADVVRATAVRADRLHRTDASLHRSGLVSMVFVYLMTVAALIFLNWFSRSRRNARVLSPGAAAGSGAWAVAAWLVPVVNLWVPRGLFLELWRASGPGPAEKERGDALVNAWWVAWAGHALTAVGAQVAGGGSLVLLEVSEVLFVVAAALVIWLIQRVTALQDAALRADSPVGPLTPA